MLKSTTSTIRLLVLLHVAAGVTVTCFCYEGQTDSIGALYFAIVFADAGLLGLLAALGSQKLLTRIIEAAVGFTYLCILVSWVVGRETGIFCGLLATSVLVVAAALGILRRRGLGLRTLLAAEMINSDEPLRFGIRHLLAWMLATAVLLKIGQSLDPNGTLGILFSYGLSFAAVSVAAPWAALGGKRPIIRSGVLVLAATFLGVAGPLYQRSVFGRGVEMAVFFATVTAFQSVILLATLGVLRRCELRLVRNDKPAARPDIVGSSEPL